MDQPAITEKDISKGFLRIYTSTILKISILFMSISTSVWLSYEFYRFLFQPEFIGFYKVHRGAIDLKIFYSMVHKWALGQPMSGSVYPPASYAILWPFIGWISFENTVKLWAILFLASLIVITYIVIKESKANTNLECIFAALIPGSMYATGASVGNGQLTLLILPALLLGILLLNRQNKANLATDIIASILILFSLVKPILSAPFFWLVMFTPKRIRPSLLVLAGYFALTAFAILYTANKPTQMNLAPAAEIISSSLMQRVFSFFVASAPVVTKVGETNIHIWMGELGLDKWVLHASLLILFILGCWIFYHRNADIWILLGVTAIVARFWSYHRWYDDLLILLPIITLFRIIKSAASTESDILFSAILLGINLCLMIAPGGLYLLPIPLNIAFTNAQAVVWMIIMIFLIYKANRV